ncbi:MAG: DUF192 domain-containing protein [Patescibacteria group bacterium]
MKIINKTKNIVLHSNTKIAKTKKEKMRGLLDALETDAMLFDTRWGIHTFGMKFPIDCAICDDSGLIQIIKKDIKPSKMFFWNPKYKRVFELPAGTLERTQTEIGDYIHCED